MNVYQPACCFVLATEKLSEGYQSVRVCNNNRLVSWPE